MRLRFWGLLAPLALLAGCNSNEEKSGASAPTSQAVAATQIDGDYLATGGDGTNWAAIGFNYYEQRYSPLDAVNRGNVSNLGIAWTADLPEGEVPHSTPIAADGKIYITTPRSRVFAFDGASGKQLWSFNPGLAQPKAGADTSDVGNQGLAIWKGRLYLATLDGQLIALDAITGAQLWRVQTGGEAGTYRITSTPRIVKNMVIIGSGRAGSGGRGYVSAYDTTDGTLRWRFYSVPSPGGTPDKASSDAVLGTAAQTWAPTSLAGAAGGFVTDAITYDPDLDRLYVGVGAGPGSDGNGGDRLFLSSIIALDPSDGEFLWQFQETPGARPSFGASQPFVLADLPVPTPAPTPTGQASPPASPQASPSPSPTTQPSPQPVRKVLMQASDNGFFFVLDRQNGKLLSATPLFDRQSWTEGYDLSTGRPLKRAPSVGGAEKSSAARSLASAETPRPNFPPVDPQRAPRWMSFNPMTGLVYFTLPRYADPAQDDEGEQTTPAPIGPRWTPEGAKIVAFDPVAGEIRWSRDLSAPRNGGPLSTAGGLVVIGTGIGRFVALDAMTGETLYNRDLGSGIVAAPSTFLIDGEQYFAVLTGLGGEYDWAAPESQPVAMLEGEPTGYTPGWLLRVPSKPRLVLLKLGANGQVAAVPGPAPSPTPQPTPDVAATPTTAPGAGTTEPRRR